MAVLTRVRGIPMSRAEYDNLREGPPFFDYIDGEAVEVNQPSFRHQKIGSRLEHVLDSHVIEHGLGLTAPAISLELPDGTIFGPDIVFISRDNADCVIRPRGDVVGIPDLVVEVLPPTTEDYDRHAKMTRYLRAGIPWLWLVDQDTLRIEEYRSATVGYLQIPAEGAEGKFRPGLFPGLEIDLVYLVTGLPTAE